MPFQYVLVWKKGSTEMLSVGGYYISPTQPERKVNNGKPDIEIGSLSGERAPLLRDLVEKARSTYGSESHDNEVRVTFPRGDEEAADMARRIGLLASILRCAPRQAAVDKMLAFVRDAPQEEIRYWTCKLRDRRVGERRAVAAICIISGSGRFRELALPSERSENI